MDATKRRKEMLDILIREGKASTVDMAACFGVSAMTIRRDFSCLEKEGIITVRHGGAVLNRGTYTEHPLSIKQEQMVREKAAIGQFCANFVNEGDAVCLDTGSTTKWVAEAIASKKNIIVLTNSLLVLECLRHAKEMKVITTPGVYREKSVGVLGEMTCDFVEGFQYDILFLACEGVDGKNGVSVPDLNDGQVKRAFVNRAKKVIAVADYTKIGKTFFMKVASWKQIDVLVTNTGADPEEISMIRNQGVEVFLV